MRRAARRPLLLAAAAALAAAGCSRSKQSSQEQRYYYEDIYAPFFAADPADPALLVPARRDANPARFPRVKAPGTLRGFLIGGSTMGGYTSVGSLGPALQAALPGVGIEVVNCGMSGYESFRERLVLAEVLALQPDFVMFLTGHNDFHGRGGRPPPLWTARLAIFMGRLPLPAFLRRRLEPPPPVATLDDYHKRLTQLEQNLRGHIRAARAAGVVPIVGVPPLAYADMAPDTDPPWEAPDFAQGWAAYDRGDWAGARRRWRKTLAALPPDGGERAFVLFHDALAAERLGRLADYQRGILESSDWSGLSVCAGACVDLIRRVAKEEGAAVADLDAAFKAAARPKLPGLRQFMDQFHWEPAMNAVISRSVVAAMRARPEFSRLPWRPLPAGFGALDASSRAESELHHGRAILFYAFAEAGDAAMRRSVSWRCLAWLERLQAMRPEWFASPETLRRALDDALAEHQARAKAGLGRGAGAEVPQPTLLAYFAYLQLRRGQAAAAAESARRAVDAGGPALGWANGVLAEALAAAGRREEAGRALDALAAAHMLPRIAKPGGGELRPAEPLRRALALQPSASYTSGR